MEQVGHSEHHKHQFVPWDIVFWQGDSPMSEYTDQWYGLLGNTFTSPVVS